MSCEKYKGIVEEYLDGTISAEKLAELENHMHTCESCREQFNRCALMQDVIKDAFSSCTPAEQAGASLVAKLSSEPGRPISPIGNGAVFSLGRQAAVAASIVLAVGLFLGFALGRAGTGSRIKSPVATEVPIQVTNIEGTVLVKHAGSDLWHGLTSESKVYLGDTFHSMAKSTCVLELDPNSTLELDQNSMLVLTSHNGTTEFDLDYGELTADLATPHGPFFISTPHGRVEALGTEFTVKVTDE